MAELVDALDSKSSAARRAGSIPALGTMYYNPNRFPVKQSIHWRSAAAHFALMSSFIVIVFSIADMDKFGYCPSQIKQSIQLDCGLRFAKWSPIKQRQTQVNRCSIRSINTSIKIHGHRRISVQLSGSRNQALSKCMIDPPVTLIEGIRDRGSCWNILQSHIKTTSSDWQSGKLQYLEAIHAKSTAKMP